MDSGVHRDVRFLKVYAGVTTVGLAVVFLCAFHASSKQKFGEVDAERINIVEPDGKLAMILTDKSHFPPPIFQGKPIDLGRQGETGNGVPGIVFFNGEETEAGGLAFAGKTSGGKRSASAGLIFDQYNQDQIVGIDYGEDEHEREAGLHVWERPDTPLVEMMQKQIAISKMPDGPDKIAAMKQFSTLQKSGDLGGQERVFVGKNTKNASEISLADAKGRPRIHLAVEADGSSRMEFLDENGKVLYSFPPKDAK